VAKFVQTVARLTVGAIIAIFAGMLVGMAYVAATFMLLLVQGGLK